MAANEEIYFISEAITPNNMGDAVITETRRLVFCETQSVGAKYKLQALAVGLHPSLRLTINDYLDYEQEEYLIYNSVKYRIIDAYRKEGNKLEITAEVAK